MCAVLAVQLLSTAPWGSCHLDLKRPSLSLSQFGSKASQLHISCMRQSLTRGTSPSQLLALSSMSRFQLVDNDIFQRAAAVTITLSIPGFPSSRPARASIDGFFTRFSPPCSERSEWMLLPPWRVQKKKELIEMPCIVNCRKFLLLRSLSGAAPAS